MRHSAIRELGFVAAVILAATSFACQWAAAQAVPAVPTPVPVAPAGGIDPSKLPDVQGIHLGMPPQEVMAKLKVLYPSVNQGIGTTVFYTKFHGSSDPAWQSNMKGATDPCIAGNKNSCPDNFNMLFSAPPNKQVAVFMERAFLFEQGKLPTLDNIEAALIQKYGTNPVHFGPNLGWAYDEQGRPLVLAPAAQQLKVQCAGNMMEPSGSAETVAQANAGGGDVAVGPPVTQASIDQMMRNTCRTGVAVYVGVSVSGPLVIGLDVKISENSEDTRDYLAMEQYLANMAATQKQQQIKHDQGIAAPKL
jgi:hypothetical protein